MVWPLLGALVVGAAAPSFLGGSSASSAIGDATGDIVEASFEAIGPAIGGAFNGIKKAADGHAYEISATTTIILIGLYLFNRMIK